MNQCIVYVTVLFYVLCYIYKLYYHYINHRKEIRAKNIATLFLNKDLNAYYHSVNLLKGKGKNSCPVIDGHSTNKEIADCFVESYKTVFNDIGYDKTTMSELDKHVYSANEAIF